MSQIILVDLNFHLLKCLEIFVKNFQTFLEAKIEINRDNLTPCQAHLVLKNLLLGGVKDEHFSYFHSSCQLGLSIVNGCNFHN